MVCAFGNVDFSFSFIRTYTDIRVDGNVLCLKNAIKMHRVSIHSSRIGFVPCFISPSPLAKRGTIIVVGSVRLYVPSTVSAISQD